MYPKISASHQRPQPPTAVRLSSLTSVPKGGIFHAKSAVASANYSLGYGRVIDLGMRREYGFGVGSVSADCLDLPVVSAVPYCEVMQLFELYLV